MNEEMKTLIALGSVLNAFTVTLSENDHDRLSNYVFGNLCMNATHTMIRSNNHRQTILYYTYYDIHTYSITHTVMIFKLYHLYKPCSGVRYISKTAPSQTVTDSKNPSTNVSVIPNHNGLHFTRRQLYQMKGQQCLLELQRIPIILPFCMLCKCGVRVTPLHTRKCCCSKIT